MKQTDTVQLLPDVRLRLLIAEESDGRMNMAIDEMLLEEVGAGRSAAVVRLYGFSPPTLSVGRFQRTVDILDLAKVRHDGLTFVRRPTGGQAVLHTEELTYAFVVAKDQIRPPGKRNVYRFVVPLLLSGLEALGINGAGSSGVQKGDPLNPDCFGSTGEYEIDTDSGRKLIGSAQMVSRTAVLQHGSIPFGGAGRGISRYFIGAQPLTDHAANISMQLGRRVGFEETRTAFVTALKGALPVDESRLSPSELARAEELRVEKYETELWNRKY